MDISLGETLLRSSVIGRSVQADSSPTVLDFPSQPSCRAKLPYMMMPLAG
jgi:hypothetical protein